MIAITVILQNIFFILLSQVKEMPKSSTSSNSLQCCSDIKEILNINNKFKIERTNMAPLSFFEKILNGFPCCVRSYNVDFKVFWVFFYFFDEFKTAKLNKHTKP